MPFSEIIQSNDTYDFIVTRDELRNLLIEPIAMQPINETYSIVYYDRTALPPLSIEDYSYTSIPKCFFLMDSTSLDVSGILSLQNQPGLALRGQGVLMGMIDTGIDYTNPLFQDIGGHTRILSIWDQGAQREETREPSADTSDNSISVTNSAPPQGFLYGVEYTRAQINQALAAENPRQIVPVTDENGHGTFLASVAAGSEDRENDFIGAAPLSELVIVKLKEAKQNLREFFYLPQNEPLYQENDIMAGIAYLESVANREGKPLVILIGLGSNSGSHVGSDPLSAYMDTIGGYTGRTIVVATGNQAAAQHHFYGEARSVLNPVKVEINIEEGIEGFCMELWSYAPEQVRVVVQSPTGQQSQGGFPLSEDTQTTNFIFENTTVTVNYRVAGRGRRDLLVFFRFSRPAAGIWTLLVYPVNAITGAFHIWLPIMSQITFIQPEPDTTITTPSAANIPITVGGYDGLTGARYIESGRGFDALGRVKPDFCAPSVDVSGAGLRNNYVTYTGTSVAAAITAGAAAQVLEWGILRGNAPTMNSSEVKNLLIRGSERDNNLTYPNPEWGYGRLDIYQSFQVLRE